MTAEHDPLNRVHVVLEVDSEQNLELFRFLGQLGDKGAAVRIESEEPLVSPSIALEYITGAWGFQRLAVTRQTVADVLEMDGATEVAAKTEARQFMDALHGHLFREHRIPGVPHLISDIYARAQGRLASPCECPLVGIWSHNDLRGDEGLGPHIDPGSLVALAGRDEEYIRSLQFQRFGAKRIGLLRRLGLQIVQDVGIEVEKSADI